METRGRCFEESCKTKLVNMIRCVATAHGEELKPTLWKLPKLRVFPNTLRQGDRCLDHLGIAKTFRSKFFISKDSNDLPPSSLSLQT